MPQILLETLQKPKKNWEDAQLIYDHIRSFRFFENFFAQNLRTMDHSNVLALCKEFGHEHIPIGRFVFQKGDPSNNKFYVILKGKIGIVIPRKDSVVAPRRSSIRKSILKRDSKKPSMEPIPIKSPRDRSQSPEEMDRPDSSKKRSLIGNDSRRTTFIANQSESESNKSGFNINLVKVPEGHSDKSSPLLKQVRSPRRSKTFQGFISSMSLKKEKEPEQETSNETSNPIVPIIPIEHIQRETPEVLSPHDEEEDEDDTPIDYNEFRDKAKFEDYASRFGVLVRYMGPGESFGELALKNNAPRSASVLCSDDCEFLVITKQQFELIFEKKDREKEEFIKTTFPFLTSMSTFVANYVLLSFKTEVVKKGSYLAKEGRVTAEDSKFYLIHKGECLVEKVVSIQLNSPLNKTKFIAKDSQTAQISVVGQGTIAGEEILINKDSYNYSVKTLSDGVLVHSVSKKDFDSIFFKDFHEHLISMYLKKKKQRDIIFENVRKDHEAKADELKAKNIYSVQNTKMNNVLSTPALQSLSRYMHREQNNMSNNTPVNANGQFSITSPKNSTYQVDSFGGFMASRNMPAPCEEDSFQIDSPTLEKKKFPKIIDLRDPNRQGVAQRLEYLNKVADSPKRRDSPAEIADFSSIKLFETEPSRVRKNIRKPSMFGGESPNNRGNGGFDIEKDSPPPSMFKEAAMRTRIRPLSIGMPDNPEHDEEPSPLLKLNMPISPITSLARVGGNAGNTESKQTTIPELSLSKSIGGHLGVHDANARLNAYAVLIGNNGNISGKYQQQNQIKMFGKPQEGSSFGGAPKSGRVALPQLRTLNLDKIGQEKRKAKEETEGDDDENSFDGFETSTKGQTTYINGTTDRPAYLSSRFGEKQYSPEKLSPEIKSAKGVFSFQSELGNLLKGYRAQHTVRLQVTKNWRSKVFQKTSGPNNNPHHKRIASEGVNVTAKLGIICSPIVNGKAAKTRNQASKAK